MLPAPIISDSERAEASVNPEKIAAKVVARQTANELIDLCVEEWVSKPADIQSEFWRVVHQRASQQLPQCNSPKSKTTFSPPRARQQAPPPPADSSETANTSRVDDAMELIAEICEKAEGDFPDAGIDFAESVAERARSIAETIERTQQVTQGQNEALHNMSAGLDRWLEREDW